METKTEIKKSKVIAYVDGYNLYFGIVQAGFTTLKWLNIEKLIKSYLKPDQELVAVKYFTARVTNNPAKQRRQTLFIEALQTTGIKIFYGKFQDNTEECLVCGNTWRNPNEKMTDVNIATQIMIDAFQDSYDTAILVSGDSDLVPPIKAVHQLFPKKAVTVFFPPERHNTSVSDVARGSLIIGRKKLLDAQFPEEVGKPDGYILRRPSHWV